MIKRFAYLSFLLLPLLAPAQKRKGVNRLLPDYAKLQFAGGIGFLSAGFGYESKNKRVQSDLSYGYVPKSIGGVTIHSVTGKFTWIPIASQLSKNVRLDWLITGALINYAFGKQYFLFSPSNHRYNYYKIPTALHGGLFVGEGIRFKNIGLYYEIGTADKDLASYIRNVRALPLTDILNFAVGIRIGIK